MTNTTTPGAGRLLLPRYAPVPEGVHAPLLSPDYRSTVRRSPARPPVDLPQRLTEVTGPLLGEDRVTERDADLTAQAEVEPMGMARSHSAAGNARPSRDQRRRGCCRRRESSGVR